MAATRVLYLLWGYPQSSQTYIKTEIEAVVRQGYDVKIVAMHHSEVDLPYEDHLPYDVVKDVDGIVEIAQDYRPDVIHSHWGHVAPTLVAVSRRLGVPFTMRTHSFDSLERRKRASRFPLLRRRQKLTEQPWRVTDALEAYLDDLCLGVLVFPFATAIYERAGVPRHKLVECWPLINYGMFHDTTPNGDRVMNSGPAIPKKAMDDYLRLAASMPEKQFDLYPLGYQTEKLRAVNAELGHPVEFVGPVPHSQMPSEYKRHEWIVYTASKQINTVGWPASIPEAQAAGVGVLFQNIRPDCKTFVGDAGFVFDTIDEARRIISQPFPEEMRAAGFEHARRSDVNTHLHLLTDIWSSALARRSSA